MTRYRIPEEAAAARVELTETGGHEQNCFAPGGPGTRLSASEITACLDHAVTKLDR